MTAAGGGEIDRISNLRLHSSPHPLLSRHSVRRQNLCIAKQWESTWKHVHSLNLKLNFHEYSRYKTFVDKVLSLRHPLHVSKVVTNGRHHDAPYDCSEFSLLREVVQYAVSHGAQHFYLGHHKTDILLLQLFDPISDTVKTLESKWSYLDCPPLWSGFQLLTTLELLHCRFVTDLDPAEPFSQFPCLKNLVLDGGACVSEVDDHVDYGQTLRVSGIQLVKLILLDVSVYKLEIFAPKLEYFNILSGGGMEFLELTVPSRVHADIQLWEDNGFCYDDIAKEDLFLMFQGLNNVKYLKLCKKISEVHVHVYALR